jgi:hypothetical protein
MVSSELMELHKSLAGELPVDHNHNTTEVSHVAAHSKTRHCRELQHLHKAQHPPLTPDNRKTIIKH